MPPPAAFNAASAALWPCKGGVFLVQDTSRGAFAVHSVKERVPEGLVGERPAPAHSSWATAPHARTASRRVKD
jgi:hypothetical protein